ncbi:MAG TPA: alpha/beta fold hydrolase [Bacteroidia bacterium]|nr:alpha/beta fold hydrolase [Bacteroidia bacterium]
MFLKVSLVLSFILSGLLNTSSSIAEIPQKDGFVQVEGASLYYRVIGEGTPLLVLHGGPGLDHSYFIPQMQVLSKDYKLIFFDQRGCGRSVEKVDSQSISIDRYLQDIEAIRNHFGLDKINVFGHSFGALIAMRYAIRFPDQVNSLLLVNPTPASSAWRDSSFSMIRKKNDPETTEKISKLMKTDDFRKRKSEAMSEFYRLSFRSSFYDPEKVNELSLHFQENYPESVKLIGQLNNDTTLINYDLHSDLKKLNIPSLIIGAEADVVHPLALEELHSALRRSHYILIESCGHFPFIEQPEQLLKSINKFFSKF